MEFLVDSVVEDGLKRFKKLTKKPEHFLGVQKDVGGELKRLLKNLYDYTKRSEGKVSRSLTASGTLPELIIKNFDEEQIWQELELQNDEKCNKFISDVSHIVARKDGLNFGVGLTVNSKVGRNKKKTKDKVHLELSGECGSRNDGYSSGHEMDGEEQQDDDNGTVGLGEQAQEELDAHKPKAKGKVKTKPSIVDDRFFKLRDLEQYLNKEDKKENQRNKQISNAVNTKKDDDTDDSDESIDYFQDTLSDEEEVEDEDIYYQNFFDPPEMEDNRDKTEQKIASGGEEDDPNGNDQQEENGEFSSSKEQEESDKLKDENNHDEKQVRFNLSPASSGLSSESEGESERAGIKSSFETRQERLKTRIEQLEEEALAEKPWQLQGNVSAVARPQNSLLEEVVEFDLTTRPAPVVTEQTTMKLEDIIQQRIKDKAWDDVERKVKPVKDPNEYKKQLVMDQEKSKLSLAEVYEQEYIKQREAQNPTDQEKPEEEPKEHQEVRAMMSSLFAKLDALSNFHYTPKPVVPEIKVISNLPAITIEEVAPVATSDAALLAPEEVKAKPKGDLIGKGERTKTDKKRERRHKKAIQRQRHRERENRIKTVQKLKPGLGNKYSKERALQVLEKVTKDKNVEEMADLGKDKGVRSSTAFFARLQEEVTSHIKAHTASDKRNKLKNNMTAKKMKL